MNSFLIYGRSILRRLGILKLIVKTRALIFSDKLQYEEKFKSAILSKIESGSTVWDIGANVGFYTTLFSKAVGGGRVYAFEPAPASFLKLKNTIEELGLNNVLPINCALGATDGVATMVLGDDPAAPTNRILDIAGSLNTIQVPIYTGTTLLGRGIQPPNLLKIDVEGFELEVIRGLSTVLLNENCRMVFCEVHFALLEELGQSHAPALIQKILKKHGFHHQKWLDASHLYAGK